MPGEPNHCSSRSARGTLVAASATYVVAFVLLIVGDAALVYGAAHVLAHGRADQVDTLASEFARSVPGMLCVGLVSSAILGFTALISARLQGRRIASRLRLARSRATFAGAAATVAGTVGLGLASGSIADLLGVGRTGSMETIARVLAHATLPQVGGAFLTIAILPALAGRPCSAGSFRAFSSRDSVAGLGLSSVQHALVSSTSMSFRVLSPPWWGSFSAGPPSDSAEYGPPCWRTPSTTGYSYSPHLYQVQITRLLESSGCSRRPERGLGAPR